MGATASPSGARPAAHAPLDAAAAAARRASRADPTATAAHQGQAARGVGPEGGGRAGGAVCRGQLTTAGVARLHRRLRQRGAALGRRSATPCTDEDGLPYQLPCSTCSPLACDYPPVGARRWLSPWPPRGAVPPAMVAGLPERVWSLRDVWRCRVPPGAQPQAPDVGVARAMGQGPGAGAPARRPSGLHEVRKPREQTACLAAGHHTDGLGAGSK